MVVYLSAGLGFPKREVRRATTAYASLTDELRSRVPARVFDLIVHTDNRAKVRRLEAWVRATETSRVPLGMLWANRGAPLRGPPEAAGGFRRFPIFGARWGRVERHAIPHPVS